MKVEWVENGGRVSPPAARRACLHGMCQCQVETQQVAPCCGIWVYSELRMRKTPRGFDIKAQGRAYPRYRGYGFIKHVNPNGVAHCSSANTTFIMCNPVGVDAFLSRTPRVARIRATVGFDVQPPWGFLTRNSGLFFPHRHCVPMLR